MFRCDLVDSDSDRWLEIPAWMFDRSACAKVRLVATDPHADISALVALASLLRDVLHDPVVVSNIPDSIVSSLSGDSNQGDVHAMSKQAGAPSSHTASSRFVRRKTTDASLVRAADGNTGSAHRPDGATNPGKRVSARHNDSSRRHNSSCSSALRVIGMGSTLQERSSLPPTYRSVVRAVQLACSNSDRPFTPSQ